MFWFDYVQVVESPLRLSRLPLNYDSIEAVLLHQSYQNVILILYLTILTFIY